MQAEAKGSSPTITGFIVSSSPLCVVVLSPILGYLVSESTCISSLLFLRISTSQLPRLGVKFTLVSGLILVGGAFVLLGCVKLPNVV